MKKTPPSLIIAILILAIMTPFASANWTGGHGVVGSMGGEAGTSRSWYFAEGTCRPSFDTFICIQNQYNPGPADVYISYMKGDSSTAEQKVVVSPRSRSTVNVKDFLGEGDDNAHDFSARITSDIPILTERSMYFNYGGKWSGGSAVIGAVEPRWFWYFAEGTCRPGFDTYFCIQNPNSHRIFVNITFMKGDGTNQKQQVVLEAHSRATVTANQYLGTGDDKAHDFSATVGVTDAFGGGASAIVERPMYFNYGGVWSGGHDVVGINEPRSNYYFAEGTCRPNFDAYFCIQNPNDSDAVVQTTYMLGNSSTRVAKSTITKKSRYTVKANDILGVGDDEAHDFSAMVKCTNGQKIIVERPMYFDYGGVWSGGSDVIGKASDGDIIGTEGSGSWTFAEGTCRPGFDTYFCIQNPNVKDVKVGITYTLGEGTSKKTNLTVPAHSRSTVKAKDALGEGNDKAHDFSTSIVSSEGATIIAERSMYFDYNHVAFTPAPPAALGVDVIQSKCAKDAKGVDKVFGIVENHTGKNVNKVKITAGCYDSQGNLLTTRTNYAHLDILDAGDTSSFAISFDPAPARAAYFKVKEISWGYSSVARNKDLRVAQVARSLPLFPGTYWVTVVVTPTGTNSTAPHDNTSVSIAYFDYGRALLFIDSADVSGGFTMFTYNESLWGESGSYQTWVNCEN